MSTFAENVPLAAPLRSGTIAAMHKLDQYFGEQWSKVLLATATALDPRLKYSYWTAAGFNPVEIDNACSRVKEAWQEFKPPDEPQERSSAQTFFLQSQIERDELQLYLNEALYPVDPEVAELDLLQYWRSQEQIRPKLAQMAKKYLAVCASSTPSERCFSQARLFIPHLRNRLKPESFRSTMLLWSWMEFLQDNKEYNIYWTCVIV